MGVRMRKLVLALLVATACAADVDVTPLDDDGLAVVGGIDARSPAYRPVGALADPSGPFCTATLIAPTLIVSARHCIHGPSIFRGEVTFRIGQDANVPEREVQVVAAAKPDLDSGGWIGVGSDVAVFQLGEPITDVPPMKIGAVPLTKTDLGRKSIVVGYGRQSQDLLAEQGVYGTRKVGNMTLRAVDGKPLRQTFATFELFVAKLAELEGHALDAADTKQLQIAWDYDLLAQHEVFLGFGSKDVQICHGDSGSPLIWVRSGTREVQGVLTGGIIVGGRHCRGAFYAAFGPRARALVDGTMACEKTGCPLYPWSAKVAPGRRKKP